MVDEPRVSIVVPVHNKIVYTTKCCAAIEAHTSPESYELILVDNASDDGTESFIAGLADKVVSVRNATNLGFVAACNQGARIARGEFIVFLNNDTEPRAGWLDALLESAESDEKIGVVGPKLLYPDGRLQEAGGIVFSDANAWNYGRGDDPSDPKYNFAREVDYVSGACLLVRKDLLQRLNGLDERYSPGYYEDTDLCFGIRSLGYKVLYCPFSEVVHHEGVTSGTDLSAGMKRYQAINREKFAAKWSEDLRRQMPPSTKPTTASARGSGKAVLVAAPELPLFDRSSGGLRLLRIMEILRGQCWHVTLIAVAGSRGHDGKPYMKRIQSAGIQVYPFDPERYLALHGIRCPGPPLDLSQILRERHYDVAYLYFYNVAAQYMDELRRFSPRTRIVVDSVDIHFVREMRMAELQTDSANIERALARKRAEIAVYAKADLTIAVTREDRDHLHREAPDISVRVIPNIHLPAHDGASFVSREGLLFVGGFAHLPNVDAVLYFVAEIWPLIKKALPSIRLYVVGDSPPPRVRSLADRDIIVTGYVSDTKEYLRSCRVSVAPLRAGAGMKGKVSEAMASGIPVVATPVAAEGLDIESGRHALVADSAEAFAKAVIDLYTDESLWTTLSTSARDLINARCSPTVVGRLLMEALSCPAMKPPEEKTAQETGTPEVSIIIPTYNKIGLLRQCLDHLRSTTQGSSCEIIVIDNASTDGTDAYLRSEEGNGLFRAEINSRNLGFAAACNQGARTARSPYLLFLNNDTIPLPGWLEPLVQTLRHDPSVGAVGSKLLFPDNTIQHAGVGIFDDRRLPDPLVARHLHYRQPSSLPAANDPAEFQALTAACLLIRREAFVEAGGFDEGYWNGYEDIDLCFTLRGNNWGIVYEPASVVIHLESQSGGERFSGKDANIRRLHGKWRGRVVPDFMIEPDGSIRRLSRHGIRPYRPGLSLDQTGTLPATADEEGLVTIIILTLNRLEDTRACLQSLRRHTTMPHEVIVVDNGSTDGTVEFLRKECAEHNNTVVILNRHNRGFAGGNNLGLSLARGRYVLLLNNDTIVTKGWIERMREVLDAYPAAGLVGPMSNCVSGPQLVSPVPYRSVKDLDFFASRRAQENAGRSIPCTRLVGFCLLIRREVIDAVGGLDERFGSGSFEDDDFCLRAAALGFQARIACAAFVHHTGSRTFRAEGINLDERLDQNWTIFRTKWGVPPDTPRGTGYSISPVALKQQRERLPLPALLFDHMPDRDRRWWADMSGPAFNGHRAAGVVSIVVACSGSPAQTDRCVKALTANTHVSHEIILAPITPRGHAASDAKKTGRSAKCKVVLPGGGGGFAVACNSGIAASSGDAIVVMCDDVIVSEGWLDGLSACARSSPRVGVVGPVMNNVDGPQNAAPYPLGDEEAIAAGFRKRNLNRRRAVTRIAGRCMYFKASLCSEIGLFDERFSLMSYAADDFCLRARLAGYENLVAGDVLVRRAAVDIGRDPARGTKALRGEDGTRFLEKWNCLTPDTLPGQRLLAFNAMERATNSLHSGRADEAVAILRQTPLMPHTAKDLTTHLAWVLIQSHQFAPALEVLKSLPPDDGSEGCLGTMKAYCHIGIGDDKAAEDILAGDSDSAAALDLQGLLSWRKGDPDGAEALFERAAALDAGYADALFNLGSLRWSQDRRDEAYALVKRAFILSPSHSDLAANFYRLAVAAGTLDEAELLFREAAALNPYHKGLRYMHADILSRLGRHDEALATVEDGISRFGPDDDALSSALHLRKMVGPRSVSHDGDPRSISLCMIVKDEEKNLVRCLSSVRSIVNEMVVVDTGSVDRTREIARAFGARVLESSWDNDFSAPRNLALFHARGTWILVMDADEVLSPDDHAALRDLVIEAGRRNVAYSFVTRNYVAQPNVTGWVRNDNAYLKEQAGSGWIVSTKVRLFRGHPDIRFVNPVHELVEPSLSRLRYEIRSADIPVHHYGKLDRAEVLRKGSEYFDIGKKKLSAADGTDVKSLVELAVQAGELGRHEEALGFWQQIIAKNDRIPRAQLGMGNALNRLGRFEEALGHLTKARELSPDLREAVVGSGLSLLCLGRPYEALALFDQNSPVISDYPQARIFTAILHHCIGQNAKAAGQLGVLGKDRPLAPRLFADVARCLIAAGQREYARAVARAIAGMEGHTPEVRRLLQQCAGRDARIA